MDGFTVKLFELIKKISKWEIFVILSNNICLLTNEDWEIKVGIDQSIVIELEIFSQFNDSVNQTWFEDL